MGYAVVGAPPPQIQKGKGMERMPARPSGGATKSTGGPQSLPPSFTKLYARTDLQGRQVVKVPKMDLARFLRRRAYLGDFITAGVSAPAQTPFDNARVLMIEHVAQQGVLFEIAEGVDGLIAEIYEATPREMSDAMVGGWWSKLKKGVSKVAKTVAKGVTKAVKVATPFLKKLGVAALAVGGVVAGVALGGPLIGVVAKFGGKLIGKAASAAAKLIGGGKSAEEQAAQEQPQPADPASPTNVPDILFTIGQKIYVAENSMVFDTITAAMTQEQLKSLGQTGQGAVGTVGNVFTHPALGNFYYAGWALEGKTIGGFIHQSMLSANVIPPAVMTGGKPTSEEMDALTAQLAQAGQKNPEAMEAAQALSQTRALVGKTMDQAVDSLQKENADAKGADIVTENSQIAPGQTFMIDAWIGTPVIGGYVVGRRVAAEIGGEVFAGASRGGGQYRITQRGVNGGYTPSYDDGLTALLGKSKSGRENPLPEYDHRLVPAAIKDLQDSEGGAMSNIVAAEAVPIQPGQKLEKGIIYKSTVPLVIKGGKAVHASLVKRIITNKWTWIGVGGAVVLGVGTGVAVHASRKKKTVGASVSGDRMHIAVYYSSATDKYDLERAVENALRMAGARMVDREGAGCLLETGECDTGWYTRGITKAAALSAVRRVKGVKRAKVR